MRAAATRRLSLFVAVRPPLAGVQASGPGFTCGLAQAFPFAAHAPAQRGNGSEPGAHARVGGQQRPSQSGGEDRGGGGRDYLRRRRRWL